MTENEIKVLRMNLLGGMDTYMREVVGDEDVFNLWLMCGVSDCATEDDLEFIAENEDEFVYTCRLFGKLINNDYTERKKTEGVEVIE